MPVIIKLVALHCLRFIGIETNGRTQEEIQLSPSGEHFSQMHMEDIRPIVMEECTRPIVMEECTEVRRRTRVVEVSEVE